MKNIALKSNHGNHTGFNRTWEVLGQSENIEDLKSILFDHAMRCSDDISLDDRGNVIDLNRDGDILYSPKDESFSYDGKSYTIITEEDYNNGIFNGGHYGYAPKEVVEYFEN